MRATWSTAVGAVALALLALPAAAGAQSNPKVTTYVVTLEKDTVATLGQFDDQSPRLDAALNRLDNHRDVLETKAVAGQTATVRTTLSAAQLDALPGIAAAEPERTLQLFDDPQQANQWHLANDGRLAGAIGADVGVAEAWATSTGAGVVVAVIDTGAELDHPDLAGQLWHNPAEICSNGHDEDHNGLVDDCVGWDFGESDALPHPGAGAAGPHGTHVAGIIAAARNNIGGVGIAPDARLMILKIADSGGTLHLSAAIAALNYAVNNGAKIINVSWGTSTPSSALRRALEYAGSKEVLVFAAAGNTGTYLTSAGPFPAGYWSGLSNVVSVAATNRHDLRASFSNYGQVTLAAPGAEILSTWVGGSYTTMSGTSMASPAAAGVAALLRTAAPAMTPAQLRFLLAATAERPPGLRGMGHGRVDAAAALAALAPDAPSLPLTAPVTPVPIERLPSITLPDPSNVDARGLGSTATVSFSPLSTQMESRLSGYRVQVGASSVVLPVRGPYRASFAHLPEGRLAVSVVAMLIGPGRAIPATSFATTGAASPPVSATVVAGHGSATVAFKLVTAFPGAEPVTGYRVTIGRDSLTTRGNQSSVTFNDLQDHAPLAVSVTVLHGLATGQVTQLGTVTPTPHSAPGAPTALNVTAGRGKVQVGWRPPTFGLVTSYRVTVGSRSFTLPSTARSATLSAPPGNAIVSVVATNAYGNSVVATINATVLA